MAMKPRLHPCSRNIHWRRKINADRVLRKSQGRERKSPNERSVDVIRQYYKIGARVLTRSRHGDLSPAIPMPLGVPGLTMEEMP